MPRPRARPLFELAGQWIAAEPGSPNLYRFWNDARTGRTRRRSLGTADLGKASRKLAEIVVKGEAKTPDSLLSAVLLQYHEERTDKLPSKKHARLAGRTVLQCWGKGVRCSELTEAKQREFALWSVAKGHSLSYISRNLSVVAAAVKHSKLPTEIHFGRQDIKHRWALQTKAPRRVFIPSDDELARFLSADLPESFFRWCIMACLTGGRPEAVLDMSTSQRNRDAGLVDLNPLGRPQNKKFRPIIREPKALARWLDRWEKESTGCRPEVDKVSTRYCGYHSVESVQTACERAREKTGIPMSAYSFRHKVVTVLRKARIAEDQIGLQLGHRHPETGITAGYGEWSPDYLAPVADALDAWWRGIVKKAGPRLNSRANPKSEKTKAVSKSNLRAKSHLRLVA